MKQEIEVVQKGGIGFVGLLQIVFIVLKLCGVISWSWVLVMLPLIISASLIILILIICAFLILFGNWVD